MATNGRPSTNVSWNYHDKLEDLVVAGQRIATALEALVAQGAARQVDKLAQQQTVVSLTPAPFASQALELIRKNAGFIDSQPAA